MNASESIDHAQRLIDDVESQVRTMAERAGVSFADYPEAAREFARIFGSEVGKRRTRKLSHYKQWWKGYAAALRVSRREVKRS